jgi:hypothetical protein
VAYLGRGRSGDRPPPPGAGNFFSVVGGSAEPPVKTLLGGGRTIFNGPVPGEAGGTKERIVTEKGRQTFLAAPHFYTFKCATDYVGALFGLLDLHAIHYFILRPFNRSARPKTLAVRAPSRLLILFPSAFEGILFLRQKSASPPFSTVAV